MNRKVYKVPPIALVLRAGSHRRQNMWEDNTMNTHLLECCIYSYEDRIPGAALTKQICSNLQVNRVCRQQTPKILLLRETSSCPIS